MNANKIIFFVLATILVFACSKKEEEAMLPDPCASGCYTYNGVALDAHSDAPINNAKIDVYEDFGLYPFTETITDSEGRFSIEFPIDSLWYGTSTDLKFVLSHDGYTSDLAGNRTEVPFTPGDFGPISFELRAYPRATLHIVFDNPTPDSVISSVQGYIKYPVDYRDQLGTATLFNEREEQLFARKDFFCSVPGDIVFFCSIDVAWGVEDFALSVDEAFEVATGDTLTVRYELQ